MSLPPAPGPLAKNARLLPGNLRHCILASMLAAPMGFLSLFTRSEIALGATGQSLVIEALAAGAVLRLPLATTPGDWGTRTPPASPLSAS